MKIVFSRKNGISPLIATVLLIAFAVALGTMIMNWTINLPDPDEEKSSGSECDGVMIEIHSIEDVPVLCRSREGSKLIFILGNIGNKDITAIKLRLLDSKTFDIFERTINYNLKVNDITKREESYVIKDDLNMQVTITPLVKSENGDNILCPAKELVYEKIPLCPKAE